jgi:hypothetical protein
MHTSGNTVPKLQVDFQQVLFRQRNVAKKAYDACIVTSAAVVCRHLWTTVRRTWNVTLSVRQCFFL